MKDHRHLHHDHVVPGLLSRQNALEVTLEGNGRVRQAKWHANIVVRWTLALTNARRPEAFLGCGPIEPRDVNADKQLVVLARTRSCARWWAVVVAHGSCLLKL